jgi:nucleolar protein 14
LDSQFTALRELIYAPDPSSSGSNSIPLGTREAVPRSLTDPDAALSTIVNDDGDYDQHVRELAFDKRSKPKDRTKTEEELALEEKEALEKAERRRQRRMLGQNESDSEDEGTMKGKRKRGADDLDFDEGSGEWSGLGVGLDQTSAPLSEASEEEDAGEVAETSNDESSDKGDAESDGDRFLQNSDGLDDEHENLVTLASLPKGKSKGKKGAKHEVPFTFPCPSNHEEFLQIIEDLDDEDIPTAVQRIRTLYHTSLGADNKFKLQVCLRAFYHHCDLLTRIM